jgi:hypothetical protein
MQRNEDSTRILVYIMRDNEVNEFIITRPLTVFEFECLQKVDGVCHRGDFNMKLQLGVAYSLFDPSIYSRFDDEPDLSAGKISMLSEPEKLDYMFSRLIPVTKRGTLTAFGVQRYRGNLAKNIGHFTSVYRFYSP